MVSKPVTHTDLIRAVNRGATAGNPANTAAILASAASATAATLTTGTRTAAASVDPTGVTECSAALNTLLAANADGDEMIRLQGTFKISGTVQITGNLDASAAVFNWVGANTGVAVQIGDGTNTLWRKRIVLPQVVNTMKVSTGWAGSSTGVKAVNTEDCEIIAQRVTYFVTGYYAYGVGHGNVTNHVTLCHLENNKRNLVLGAGTAGWSNSNEYALGSLSHESAEGSSASGARQILVEAATNLVNGNVFAGGSIEGDTAEYHIDCAGLYNRFTEVRYEATGGARIIWRANATRNLIDHGYGAENIVETHVAGSNFNNVLSMGSSRIIGSTSKAVHVLENTTSADVAADAVMDPGATLAGTDPATGYRVYRTGNKTKMKRATDAYDRIILDHDNGRVYLGAGASAPTIYIGTAGTELRLEGQLTSAGGALSGNPTGYLEVYLNGASKKIPYWDA